MLSGFHRSEPKVLVVSEIYPHMNSAKEEPPNKELSPPWGCTPLRLPAYPLILYLRLKSLAKCHCLLSGLSTGISFHLHYLLTP